MFTRKLAPVILSIILMNAPETFSQGKPNGTYTPQIKPVLNVTRASGPIKIDGDLSDKGWQGAKPASNFSETYPEKNIAPPVRTEAFVTYDDNNLYLAAVCYADPKTVRASICERENIFSDDNIGFFFDTYGDANRAYIINLNPYGIPYDALWSTGNGEDNNFDLIFESNGKITDSGYQVEMAIPFSSLRFPNKPVQEWRFDFYRHHLRESHYQITWVSYDKNESCWPCNWGSVNGIENIKPGKGIELLPSVVTHQAGEVKDNQYPDTTFKNGDVYGDLSIGAKYAVSSDVTLEATYNPDFSQIEADASQVDVNSTFALAYSEKRPFFQEGMDLFLTNLAIVYTRSINNPDFAAKASAKLGRTSIAYLSAHDEQSLGIIPFEERSRYVPIGSTFVNMLAIRQSFGQSSYIRTVITDQQIKLGGSGTLASIDGTLRLNKPLSVRGQFVASYTAEANDSALTDSLKSMKYYKFSKDSLTAAFDGETFWGTGTLVGLSYSTNDAEVNIRGYQRTATYRAANGIQPQNNDRRILGDFGYVFPVKGKFFQRCNPHFSVGRIWNFDGVRKNEYIDCGVGMRYRFAQLYTSINYTATKQRFGGVDFRNIWQAYGSIDINPSSLISGSVNISYGNQISYNDMKIGKQTDLDCSLEIRPTQRLAISPNFTFSRSVDNVTKSRFFNGYISRTKFNYQFSKQFSLRLVTEYNDFYNQWNIDPLVTYRLNAFSTFFAGATYDYSRLTECGDLKNLSMTCLAQRQFFIKIQYLIQS